MNGMQPVPHGQFGVALVGLGNSGSQTVALLPGVAAIGRVILIDPDSYTAANLGHQRIAPGDVGRRKVDVQARELRRMAPHIDVVAIACGFESLPLGVVRSCDVVLACVDSRLARQSINTACLALGRPWIDAALDRGGLVRARIYARGGDCLECAWSAADRALLEQRAPCEAAVAGTPKPTPAPTAAPPEYGALAAALQVSQLRRLLANDGTSTDGRQFFLDALSGTGWVGRYTANADCAADHRPWAIAAVGCSATQLSLRDALRLVEGGDADGELALFGSPFVHRRRCVRCGSSRKTKRVHGRLRAAACRRCGGAMAASAADVSDTLAARQVPARLLDAAMSTFGIVDGDVLTLRTPRETRHVQFGCTAEQGAR